MPSKIPDILVPETVYRIPKNYAGLIIVSDVDRTYLDTQIHSIGGLLRAAFERPERKHNVPGFSLLLRALRRGPVDDPSKNPLFFLSASPPQLEPTLRAKMDIDGIEHDGLILKDQLQHIRHGAFKKLREQLGYKLGALLSLWYYLPKTAKLVLFGDDSESDAQVFTLFSVVASGQLYGTKLYELLLHLGVYRQEAIQVAWLARHFEKCGAFPVQAAFINLDLNLNPTSFGKYAPTVYPTENSLQAAAITYENTLIRMKAVVSVAKEMLLRYDWSPEDLGQTLIDGVRKFLYTRETAVAIAGALLGADVILRPLEKFSEFALIDKPARGYLPRHWALPPRTLALADWKKLLQPNSM